MTDSGEAISRRIENDYDVEAGEDAAEFDLVKARSNFLATSPSPSPSLRCITLPAGGSLTLILQNIPNGKSLFSGKVNANGALSVRNGESWLVHVHEDKVAVQGNLRVHGAFRSDS
ncbi:hypothetical protein [Streptomyces chrestomyceticus]|uniref:hypothetical protein n=1 Tax=Streptomyces chrestomyceticus TaxID=68185 RepID=UPI0033C793AD